MEATEEDDLKLLRASVGLLTDLQVFLGRILWKTSKDTGTTLVHRLVREKDLDRAISKVILRIHCL
jgi:hypothetical protein